MPLPRKMTKTASLQHSFIFASALLSGCTSTLNKHSVMTAMDKGEIPRATSARVTSLRLEHSPDVQLGRYTRANTSPRPEQLDLLSQVIDMQIPRSLTPTVQNALNHVLRYSGYSLCPATNHLRQLYAHSLPASHYRLGPITLRNALVTLTGPAWQPTVDENARRICFVPLIAPAMPVRLLSGPEGALEEAKP